MLIVCEEVPKDAIAKVSVRPQVSADSQAGSASNTKKDSRRCNTNSERFSSGMIISGTTVSRAFGENLSPKSAATVVPWGKTKIRSNALGRSALSLRDKHHVLRRTNTPA